MPDLTRTSEVRIGEGGKVMKPGTAVLRLPVSEASRWCDECPHTKTVAEARAETGVHRSSLRKPFLRISFEIMINCSLVSAGGGWGRVQYFQAGLSILCVCVPQTSPSKLTSDQGPQRLFVSNRDEAVAMQQEDRRS